MTYYDFVVGMYSQHQSTIVCIHESILPEFIVLQFLMFSMLSPFLAVRPAGWKELAITLSQPQMKMEDDGGVSWVPHGTSYLFSMSARLTLLS